MKRRRFVQAALALPAGSAALLAQGPVSSPQGPPPGVPPGGPGMGAGGMEYPKFETSTAELAATPVVHFFSAPQLAALKRVSDILMPRTTGAPGAIDAGVPEFLDFWISKAAAAQQQVYTSGLDALNKQAVAKFKKPFAELDDAAAAAVIDPAIKVQWNFTPPADPLAHFLQEARRDVRAATMNSREYASAAASSDSGGRGGRRQGGIGMYWSSLD